MKILVIIPTFNNDKTIENLLKKTLLFATDILVVNDGSTDKTQELLYTFDYISILDIPINAGKGNAIRQAIEWATNRNYTHIVTMDADGQHKPEELPIFFDAIKQNDDSIILGCRDFSSNAIPFASRLGRKCSNAAFKLTTKVSLKDTQSGFRTYPVKQLSNLSCTKNHYDFEMEVLLKAVAARIPIKEVNVSVLYSEETKKMSHFKPLIDTLRIAKSIFGKTTRKQ